MALYFLCSLLITCSTLVIAVALFSGKEGSGSRQEALVVVYWHWLALPPAVTFSANWLTCSLPFKYQLPAAAQIVHFPNKYLKYHLQ